MRMHIAALCAALALGLAACVTDNTAERPVVAPASAATSGIAQVSAPASMGVAELRRAVAGRWEGGGTYTPDYGGSLSYPFDSTMSAEVEGAARFTFSAPDWKPEPWESPIVVAGQKIVMMYGHEFRQFDYMVERGVPTLRTSYNNPKTGAKVVVVFKKKSEVAQR